MSKKQSPVTFAFGGNLPSVTSDPQLVGHKAYNLMRMAEIGLPIPPGIVITTRVCLDFLEQGRLPGEFWEQLSRDIEQLERAADAQFGGRRRPLLFSVRSGAPVSMPGMMDTLLNVGVCDSAVSAMICMTGNPRFVWDSYRRFVQTYAEVIRGQAADPFERIVAEQLRSASVPATTELDCFALRELTQQFLRCYERLCGEPFPQDPRAQLRSAIEAVFHSWLSPRARDYRRLHRIDDGLGTAVTVQSMVFGNMGSTSGSGVAFTRDPTTGESRFYMDFLWNAQGEDVVSGRYRVLDGATLAGRLPAVDRQLREVCQQLEHLFRDVQDFEFTIQEGQLHLLQSRSAKRTPWAALRIACDLVQEGLIDTQTALRRLREVDLKKLQLTRLAEGQAADPLAFGVAACPGVATGPIAFDPQTAVALADRGQPPILVRHDISTEDVAGLAASRGILTALGGRTSHAAVVARQMDKVCIVGCQDLTIGQDRKCHIGGVQLSENDFLSLDGHSGAIYAGKLKIVREQPNHLLQVVESWKQAVEQ